jgi:hypothetical protein
MQYDLYRDPAQQAFTVEIPRDWRVAGHSVQVSPVITQASVTTNSPDRAMGAILGDYAPIYVVPDAYQAASGHNVGDTYVDTSKTPVTVEPYAPGTQWVIDYLLPTFPGPQVVSNTPLPNLAHFVVPGVQARYDAGVLRFTFQRKGQTVDGGAVCITELDAAGPFTDWHVWRLYAWWAPPDRFAEATGVAIHMAKTFAIDPDWARQRGEAIVQQSQIIAQEESAVSNTIQSAFEYRQSVRDEISTRIENGVFGTVTVTDPQRQQTFRVDATPNYDWIDNQGNIYGTTTDTAPGVDFRQLLEQP